MRRLLREEAGATMVEYGFVLLFIVLAAIVAVQAFGGSVRELFDAGTSIFQ